MIPTSQKIFQTGTRLSRSVTANARALPLSKHHTKTLMGSQCPPLHAPLHPFSIARNFSTSTPRNQRRSGPCLAVRSSPIRTAHATHVSQNLPPWLEKVPPTSLTTLPNGMRVASEEGFGETAAVGVYINAGSVYENAQNNGVAHFLEHMSFKGTSRRTQHEIEVEVENIGASLNAYTSREQTAFLGHSTKEHIPQLLDILSDILQNSLIRKEAVEAERSVILTEMRDVNNRSEELLFDLLHASAFPDSSLGYTILGPEQNIRTISRDDLKSYVRNHYTADRMFLICAGAYPHEELVNVGSKLFSSLPERSTSPLAPYPSDSFSGSLVTVPDDTMDVTHVIIAHEGVGAAHPDQFVLSIIQGMAGNWDRRYGVGKTTSPLCEAIAQKQLVHSIQPFNTLYRRTCLFGIYAIAKPECVRELFDEIYGYFHYLANDVTEDEVARAKERHKNQLVMQVDNFTASCEDMGRQFLMFDRRVAIPELFLRTEAVTVEDVKRVSRNILTNQFPAVAAMGPLKEMPSYDEIVRLGQASA